MKVSSGLGYVEVAAGQRELRRVDSKPNAVHRHRDAVLALDHINWCSHSIGAGLDGDEGLSGPPPMARLGTPALSKAPQPVGYRCSIQGRPSLLA